MLMFRRFGQGVLAAFAAVLLLQLAHAFPRGGGAGQAPASLSFVTTSPLPGGSVGVSYSDALQATGGTPPYTFSFVSSTGTNTWTVTSPNLTGTPTTAETDTLSLKVTDSATPTPASVTQPFSLTVTQPGSLPSLAITSPTTDQQGWTFGQPFKQGDVPAGDYVSAAGGTSSFQADERNFWP